MTPLVGVHISASAVGPINRSTRSTLIQLLYLARKHLPSHLHALGVRHHYLRSEELFLQLRKLDVQLRKLGVLRMPATFRLMDLWRGLSIPETKSSAPHSARASTFMERKLRSSWHALRPHRTRASTFGAFPSTFISHASRRIAVAPCAS